jgi:hypothetical protein
MVTKNPAKLLNWSAHVGSIAAGMDADLLVVDDMKAANPYRNLIQARETNVQLVVVGGAPIYGDHALLQQTQGAGKFEDLPEKPSATRPKGIVIKYSNVPNGTESVLGIEKALTSALKYDPTALALKLNTPDSSRKADPYHARSTIEKWLVAAYPKHKKPVPANLSVPTDPITADECNDYIKFKYPNAAPIAKLDPIFEVSDDTYFEALAANLHFRQGVLDVKKLESYR